MTFIQFADDDQEERITQLRQELEKEGETIIPIHYMPADMDEKLLTHILESRSSVPISLWDLLKTQRL